MHDMSLTWSIAIGSQLCKLGIDFILKRREFQIQIHMRVVQSLSLRSNFFLSQLLGLFHEAVVDGPVLMFQLEAQSGRVLFDMLDDHLAAHGFFEHRVESQDSVVASLPLHSQSLALHLGIVVEEEVNECFEIGIALEFCF